MIKRAPGAKGENSLNKTITLQRDEVEKEELTKYSAVNDLLNKKSLKDQDILLIISESAYLISTNPYDQEAITLTHESMKYNKRRKSLIYEYKNINHDIKLSIKKLSVHIKKFNDPLNVKEKSDKQNEESVIVYAWGTQMIKLLAKHFGIKVEIKEEDKKDMSYEAWVREKVKRQLEEIKKIIKAEMESMVKAVEKAISDTEVKFENIIKILECCKTEHTLIEPKKKINDLFERVEFAKSIDGLSTKIDELHKKIANCMDIIRNKINEPKREKEQLNGLNEEKEKLIAKPEAPEQKEVHKEDKKDPTTIDQSEFKNTMTKAQGKELPVSIDTKSPSDAFKPPSNPEIKNKIDNEKVSSSQNESKDSDKSLTNAVPPKGISHITLEIVEARPKSEVKADIRLNIFFGLLSSESSNFPLPGAMYPYARAFEGSLVILKYRRTFID